ncbi:hypothetical protein RvY_03097 [Ramazzottius varieornatus]|uniref:Uncharacterized protein n=1 Tax=Ramazzottius varieornatus TaxID=947166 RepID=A0A1D1ULV8_RAMVA|nr:hypothetical protein RvY_03097 [Ramazzottius varieornatus]
MWDQPLIEKVYQEFLESCFREEKAGFLAVSSKESGRLGLKRKYSTGGHSRQDFLNEFLRRALVSCQAHAVLKPHCVLCDDSKKHPDGMTLAPWREGKALAWDVTCVDTLLFFFDHLAPALLKI